MKIVVIVALMIINFNKMKTGYQILIIKFFRNA
jgi:hypothetical protein